MKKIIIVSNTTPLEMNGQAIMLNRLFSGLPQQNYNYICKRTYSDTKMINENTYDIMPLLPITKKSSKVRKTISLLLFPLEIYPAYKKMIKILKKEKADIVVSCSGSLVNMPAAFLAARKLRLPFYPYMFDIYGEQNKFLPLKVAGKIFEKIIVCRSEEIIVPNEVAAQYYSDRYNRIAKIVRNPCDISRYKSKIKMERNMSDNINITYTGDIYTAQKDAIMLMFDAIKELNDEGYNVTFNIYTNEEGKKAMHYDADFLKMHSFVSNDKIHEIQKKADILFLPLSCKSGYSKTLINSSSPGKFAEYLASGKFIITYTPFNSFVSEYCFKNNCGWNVYETENIRSDLNFMKIYIMAFAINLKTILVSKKKAIECSKDFDIKINQERLYKILMVKQNES